mgnify:CR=1 FL=1
MRLFDNLINNAIKYGKEGKLLIVKTRTQKEAITVDIINFGKGNSAKGFRTAYLKSFTVLKVQEIPLQEEQVLVLRLQQMWRVYTEVQLRQKAALRELFLV